MSRPLTAATSLDNLKKEAKRWLKALRANDEEARARLDRAWPGAPAEPGLRDVRHALALEHAVPGWRRSRRRWPTATRHQRAHAMRLFGRCSMRPTAATSRASPSSSVEVVKLFLAHGADPTMRNKQGLDAAACANRRGLDAAADLLRSATR